MNANPILLQKKYVRVVEKFAERADLSLDEALSFFYLSKTYDLMSHGISDMHCMIDDYLAEDLCSELYEKKQNHE